MKEIPGFNGWYSITKDGEVWSHIAKNGVPLPHLVKQRVIARYSTVGLISPTHGRQKHYRVHRLIAMTYIKNHEGKPLVNHKDGNKLNNRVSNLEWCTNTENMEHAKQTGLIPRGVEAPAAKLSEENVREVLIAYKNSKSTTQFDLSKYFAKKFGVGDRGLRNVMARKTWKHIEI